MSANVSLEQPPSDSLAGGNSRGIIIALVIAAVVLGAMLVLFRDSLYEMNGRWQTPEYNHAPLIPLVALYLLWLRARELGSLQPRASWFGVVVLVVALAILTLGNLSAVLTLSQYAVVLTVAALAIAATGLRALSVLWIPLVYLGFMVPIPAFIEYNLTSTLQLISSQLGVAVIRAAGLSVYLEGNVIDLGSYKLQVAEACSGMRYLFPLLSFGFLSAVLFRGRLWQRLFIVASTVPITILMNSFRIGIIGILVNFFGIEQAEGFIHDFEGWVVFMACVLVLFLEIWIFARMNGDRFLTVFGLDIPPLADLTGLLGRSRAALPVIASVAILVGAAAISLVLVRPDPVLPERERLSRFPLVIGDWQGKDGYVDRIYLDALRLSDYLMASYTRPADKAPVELWVAYYDTQVSGASVHSPKACLPGGGWKMKELDEHVVPDVGPGGEALRVNRALITQGDSSQLVYYWFEQRGRALTDELSVKWFIFQDGLAKNRTDGALVRIITSVKGQMEIPEADQRLEAFVRAIDPQLAYHLPDEKAAPRRVAAAR